MTCIRLAIVTSHPIQYHAPWFRALAARSEIDLQVLFCHQASPKEQSSAGFNVEFEWDSSLLEGYQSQFLRNVATKPSIHGFSGLDTPDIGATIMGEGYDAVIVNGWHYKSAWQTIRAGWRTKTPVMVRSDSHLHSQRSSTKRIGKWPLYRWFIPRLDACLPVGKWSRDYFLHYGASPEKIFIVPHVVDESFFAGEADRLRPQREEIRAKWNLDAGATVFLFAGKFVEKKRPLDFLKAIDLAAKRGANVAGLMAGDGPLRKVCEAFVSGEKTPVTFTGFMNQSEITKAYIAADALVLPSDGGETWGLVVNEAMVCGLSAIVSDHVGCGPDLITAGKTGFVFPLGDVAALADLIFSYPVDKAKQREMSENAKERAKSYTAVAAAGATVSALQSVLAVRKRDL